jgi:hypothetical protein
MNRKFLISLACIPCLIFVFGLLAQSSYAAEGNGSGYSKGFLPSLQLTSLDQSKQLLLPLAGKHTFLAVGFHPNVQGQLEKSMMLAQAHLPAGKADVRVYEIPVIEASKFPNNGVTRFFMKQQIQNKRLLPIIYPYYTNLRAFQKRLGLSESETMVFLLVNKSGQIVWSKKSNPTESEIKSWNALLG